MARSIVFLVLVLALVALAANVQQVAAQCEHKESATWGCIWCCAQSDMSPAWFNGETSVECQCE